MSEKKKEQYIAPKKTKYKGIEFRSRLEARWAVFFDACGVEWDYEPEGFELPDGTGYLPDFRLKNVIGPAGCEDFSILWVEVKGVMDEEGLNKVRNFAYAGTDSIQNPIIVLGDIPKENTVYDIWGSVKPEPDENHFFDDCFLGGSGTVRFLPGVSEAGSFRLFECPLSDYHAACIMDNKRTRAAYHGAVSAKFEWGESGAPKEQEDGQNRFYAGGSNPNVRLGQYQDHQPAGPVRYKGITFQSLLEARWAVFFDTCGVNWEYEPECIGVPDEIAHLPAFRLENACEQPLFCDDPGDGSYCVEVSYGWNEGTAPLWVVVEKMLTRDKWDAIRNFAYGGADTVQMPTIVFGDLPKGYSTPQLYKEVLFWASHGEGVFSADFMTHELHRGSLFPGVSKAGGFRLFDDEHQYDLYEENSEIDDALTLEAYQRALTAKFSDAKAENACKGKLYSL